MIPSLLNYIGFQVGWLACVAGTGNGHLYLGPAVSVPLLAAHLVMSSRRVLELKRLLAVAAFGLVLELLAASAGQYRYLGSVSLLPLWVAALWLLFAATLNSSFAWLSGRPLLAAALGALAGPLSFKAGVGLGAGEYLTSPLHASLALAVLWGLALPGAFFVSRRFS